jgi:excisionase family DNA binding protein
VDGIQLLRVTDAAKLLGVSRTHLYKLARIGSLRLVRLGPQVVRVLRADVEKIAQEGLSMDAIRQMRRGGGGRER